MDVAKFPVGFSQLDTLGMIYLSGDELGATQATLPGPAQSRDHNPRPFKRNHQRLGCLRLYGLAPAQGNLKYRAWFHV